MSITLASISPVWRGLGCAGGSPWEQQSGTRPEPRSVQNSCAASDLRGLYRCRCLIDRCVVDESISLRSAVDGAAAVTWALEYFHLEQETHALNDSNPLKKCLKARLSSHDNPVTAAAVRGILKPVLRIQHPHLNAPFSPHLPLLLSDQPHWASYDRTE